MNGLEGKTVTVKTVSYEHAIKELEQYVVSLESGELTLDEAMKAYEKGAALSVQLHEILKERQGRVEILSAKMRVTETENLNV